MVASSTERAAPLRCAEACRAQMVAHLTVAYTCHQCTRSGVIASPPAAGVGGQQLVERAEAPDLAACRRNARRARTAIRCPRPGRPCAPAPSRARRAARPDRPGGCPSGSHRAPSTRGPSGGRWAASQRTPSSSAGRTSPSASRKGRGSPSGSDGASPSIGARVDGVDGGQGRPAWAVRARPGPGPFGVAQDLARDGLALEALDHQPARAEVVALAQAHDRRAPGRRRRAPPQERASMRTRPLGAPTPRSIWRMSGRGGAARASPARTRW